MRKLSHNYRPQLYKYTLFNLHNCPHHSSRITQCVNPVCLYSEDSVCLVRTMVPFPVIREKLRPSQVKPLAGARAEFRDQELRVGPYHAPT